MGNDNTMDENSNGNTSLNMDVAGIDIPQDNQSDELVKLEETGVLRDEKGRILPGQQSLNPLGRGAGQTLKEYKAKKYKNMTDREKDEELAKMSPELQWKMAEGNPHQTSDNNITGDIIVTISKEAAEKYGITPETISNIQGQE